MEQFNIQCEVFYSSNMVHHHGRRLHETAGTTTRKRELDEYKPSCRLIWLDSSQGAVDGGGGSPVTCLSKKPFPLLPALASSQPSRFIFSCYAYAEGVFSLDQIHFLVASDGNHPIEWLALPLGNLLTFKVG